MNGSESRHEFRVVLDGLELDDGQRELVAVAVQKAALEALASASVATKSPLIVGHGSLRLDPGWRGIWVLDGESAEELGRGIQGLRSFG